MLERTVEQKCVREARRRRGVALKLVPVDLAGFPDRTILLPGGRIAFVETKRPGARPRELQKWWHKNLRHLGFQVGVPDTPEAVVALFDEWFGLY